MNSRRRRRSADSESSPAEDHVVADVIHPCFYVDNQNTEYCVDSKTCWTLEDCTAQFPNDFPVHSDDMTLSNDLDDVMAAIRLLLQNHIDHITESTETHNHIMTSIEENASKVLQAHQTFDDAVDEIIKLIQTL